MEIALVEYFPGHGFEAWITDVIEIGAGMGDVFSTRDEALIYAQEHSLPVVDISHIDMSFMEGEELRKFMSQFLELDSSGGIISIK
jgi:hypothetical protein